MQTLWKTVWRFLKKLKIELLHDPNNNNKKKSINRDPENLSSLYKIPQVEKEMREDSNDPIS